MEPRSRRSPPAALGSVRGVSPHEPGVLGADLQLDGRQLERRSSSTAITAAVQNGAGVINISAAGAVADAAPSGQPGPHHRDRAGLQRRRARRGALGQRGQGPADAPGAYPHVLTVGSGDTGQGRDLFSNSGPWIDLLAPATDIVIATAHERLPVRATHSSRAPHSRLRRWPAPSRSCSAQPGPEAPAALRPRAPCGHRHRR